MGLGVWGGFLRPQGVGVGENKCSSALASSPPALVKPFLHLFKKKLFLAFTLHQFLQCKDGRNEPLQINYFVLLTTSPFPMWRSSEGLKGLEHIEVGNGDWLFRCHSSCLC